ncbi:copper chaperone PCu(A)C [Sagittula sp. S175]|uniref:copper chaperone PCu(A)C n=1 Tax=Sagittula sp. S175 TaxID=3415129 RepID=UPI003C7BB675
MFKTILSGVVALTLAVPAFAEITIVDPYARSAGKMAKAGAAFFTIENSGDEADRLIDAKSDIAVKVELHTHKDMGDGVMKMVHVPEGFVVPANGTHALARGGDHVMFMGLKGEMNQGDTVSVTLVFEKAGEMVVEVPVDLERQDGHMMGQGHGKMHGMKMGN